MVCQASSSPRSAHATGHPGHPTAYVPPCAPPTRMVTLCMHTSSTSLQHNCKWDILPPNHPHVIHCVRSSHSRPHPHALPAHCLHNTPFTLLICCPHTHYPFHYTLTFLPLHPTYTSAHFSPTKRAQHSEYIIYSNNLAPSCLSAMTTRTHLPACRARPPTTHHC
jgi:hypothetical protein